MPKSEKGNNSVNFSHNFMKNYSGHLHHLLKSYARYHVPSSSGSPDILFTMLFYHKKCQSWKRVIIQPNIDRILPKVTQVIYTLDTICTQNIMILAQAVLRIFCSQGSIRGITLQWQLRRPTEKKKILVRLLFMLHPYIKFQDPVANSSWPSPSVTDWWTDRPKPICSLNFFEVGGIKKERQT